MNIKIQSELKKVLLAKVFYRRAFALCKIARIDAAASKPNNVLVDSNPGKAAAR